MTKKSPTAKPAAKKVTAKKTTAKKVTAKKTTAKKVTAKKTTAKKVTATGAPAKRTTAKRSTAKKIAPRKRPTAATKKKPTPAKKPPAKKTATTTAGALHATLARLDEALLAYAPTRKAAMRPASSLAALEQLGPVPEALRALWAWCDGCSELLPISASADAAQLDLLSASEAAEALASIREAREDEDEDATFPHVPFATEAGSGNFVVLDARGRALYWDHEEGAVDPDPVAPSLDALLARALAAVQKKRLFGGPEVATGTPHPGVARCEKLLRDPAKNFDAIMEKTSYYGQTNALPPADRYRLRRSLAAVAATRSAEERAEFQSQLADSAIEAGALDDALALLDAEGADARSGDTRDWRVLGDAALQAGRYELAAEAFARDTSPSPGYASLSPVGEAVALWRAGSPHRAALTRAKMALAEDLAAGDASSLCMHHTHAAVLAHVEGDQPAVARHLAAARAARTNPRLAAPEDLDLAIAAGLFTPGGAG